MNALVEMRGVAKRYPLVHRKADRMRALMRLLLGLDGAQSVTVLEDVTLTIARGESLGIIGENGAGKSTLLKVLTGVLHPSSGTVAVNGSLAALLELGAGFHPEYTGRQNIATAAALMGMTAAETSQKVDEIIEFADIGRYIDEPIKHYSTGMVVRLGFAIVAARKPELLITDEVLAVGDESFQKKCVRWIEEYLTGGGTLLLVSHSMYHVQKLCKHALWMHQGRVRAYGDVFEVTQDYLAYHERKTAKEAEAEKRVVASSEGYRVETIALNGRTEDLPLTLPEGRILDITAEVYTPDQRTPHIAIGLIRADGTAIYGTSSEIDGAPAIRISDTLVRYALRFDALPLLPGGYTLRFHAMDPEGLRVFDTRTRELLVRGDSREFGLVRLAHQWH